MIHPLTGTLANSNCPTFEMRSCQTPLSSIWSNIFSVAPHSGPTPLSATKGTVAIQLVLYQQLWKVWSYIRVVPGAPLAPYVSLHTSVDAICGKCNIFPQTWWSHVLLAWWKLVCAYRYFLVDTIHKVFSYLYYISSRMRNLQLKSHRNLLMHYSVWNRFLFYNACLRPMVANFSETYGNVW